MNYDTDMLREFSQAVARGSISMEDMLMGAGVKQEIISKVGEYIGHIGYHAIRSFLLSKDSTIAEVALTASLFISEYTSTVCQLREGGKK